MIFFQFIVSFALLCTLQVLATPTARGSNCLSDAEAQNQANHFAELVTNYSNASADAYLTPDFTDYTDSVIELMNGGCPNDPIPVSQVT